MKQWYVALIIYSSWQYASMTAYLLLEQQKKQAFPIKSALKSDAKWCAVDPKQNDKQTTPVNMTYNVTFKCLAMYNVFLVLRTRLSVWLEVFCILIIMYVRLGYVMKRHYIAFGAIHNKPLTVILHICVSFKMYWTNIRRLHKNTHWLQTIMPFLLLKSDKQ